METNPYIKALSRISKTITSELYLDDVLRLIVIITAEAMGSKICSLMLIDEKDNLLKIRATQSISEEYNKKPALKIGEGVAGTVAKENKPLVIKDVTRNHRYKYAEIAKKEGLRSLLSVPLQVKGKVIGVLSCYTTKRHHFSETEVDTLSSIANQAAIAIENTKLMTRSKTMEAELETRKKFERAKGILMREEGLTEEQAYLKIQKYSMDHRKTIREISEAIILQAEIQKSHQINSK